MMAAAERLSPSAQYTRILFSGNWSAVSMKEVMAEMWGLILSMPSMGTWRYERVSSDECGCVHMLRTCMIFEGIVSGNFDR